MTYTKTERSRRRVPLRAKVVEALADLPRHDGVLFPNSASGRIDINNWRSREWAPALKAAGVEHRRIYDLRSHLRDVEPRRRDEQLHALARMGTSVQMIDATYGQLARDADDYDRGLLDASDQAEAGFGHVVGTVSADQDPAEDDTPLPCRRFGR